MCFTIQDFIQMDYLPTRITKQTKQNAGFHVILCPNICPVLNYVRQDAEKVTFALIIPTTAAIIKIFSDPKNP